MAKTAQARDERDPFAPIEASPRFATPLAVLALGMAVLCVVSYAEAVAGPLGMALGLIAHVKGALAHYKAPKNVLFVDTIGRAPNGKVDYKRMKAHALDELGIDA